MAGNNVQDRANAFRKTYRGLSTLYCNQQRFIMPWVLLFLSGSIPPKVQMRASLVIMSCHAKLYSAAPVCHRHNMRVGITLMCCDRAHLLVVAQAMAGVAPCMFSAIPTGLDCAAQQCRLQEAQCPSADQSEQAWPKRIAMLIGHSRFQNISKAR